MRKLFCLFAFFLAIQTSVLAQQKTLPASKEAAAAEEIKAALVSKLQFSSDAADKILVIENDFHTSLASINATKNLTTKEKEKQLNVIHVARRSKLMETPMSPGQMEAVVELVESIRRKHKL